MPMLVLHVVYRVINQNIRYHVCVLPFCYVVEKICLGTVKKLSLLFYYTVQYCN